MHNDNIKNKRNEPENKITVSASILSANFLKLGQEIDAMVDAGIDSFHLDVMDNHMAPSLSFGPPVIAPIRSLTTLPLDAHLMIDAPWLFFDPYIDCGVNEICFHIEAYCNTQPPHEHILKESRIATDIIMANVLRDIDYLQKQNIKACITLNPFTSPNILSPLLSAVDSVLIMSVHPGFSGQAFLPSAIEHVRQIRNQFNGDIKVDGGVKNAQAPDLIKAGASTLISASYLFHSNNYKEAIESLRVS